MKLDVTLPTAVDNFSQLVNGKSIVAQYKRLLTPKEVLQRTFEEYLELSSDITDMEYSQ